MLNRIRHISILILSVMGLLSCAMEEASQLEGEGTVIIAGIVTDADTGAPLRNIKITFEAFSPKGRLIETMTAYSSSDGIYGIEAEGFRNVVNCVLTASEQNGAYKEARIDINIPWDGASFDREKGIFVVNDCNFYLHKN